MEKKNIHVIPTTPNDETGGGIWIKETRDWCNLYITSGEEVKEKDWVLCSNGNIKKVTKSNSDDRFIENWQKIILTTDQDLIQDGVQAIDDAFLEWFVNHPECEVVEVTYGLLRPFESENKGYIIHCPSNEVVEEPKSLNMKKKTIEEAAEHYTRTQYPMGVEKEYPIADFISGAEWYANNQIEQMYSEEEVINIIIKRDEVIDLWYSNGLGYNYPRTKEWFTQFKKS
jgi:hypothetical protein